MKIGSNKVSSIVHFFRSDLTGIYDKEEIENFIFLAFEHLLGFEKKDLFLKMDQTVNESKLLELFRLIKRLKNHEPIQYVMEKGHFFGMDLKTGPGVLIPRPETEELVDWIIQSIKESKKNQPKILDIGTGSGCIAIALKKNIKDAEIQAWDISEVAMKIARENAINQGTNIIFKQVDVLNLEPEMVDHQFDIIVSNPPYITRSESVKMQKNVLEHEPHLALFVEDQDPLLFYRKIAELSHRLLAPQGKVFFEINENLGEEMRNLLGSMGFKKIQIKKDLSGKDRMVKCEYF